MTMCGWHARGSTSLFCDLVILCARLFTSRTSPNVPDKCVQLEFLLTDEKMESEIKYSGESNRYQS